MIGVQPGPIEAFIPVMVFAIVFGLSMDYDELFLVSRNPRGVAASRRRERGRAP